MLVMAFISTQVGLDGDVGVDEAVARTGARFADRVSGAGLVINFVSCSFDITGTGPSSSETWKSKMNVCLNQDRSRWKKAGLCPRASDVTESALDTLLHLTRIS